ncbi:MAG: 3-methyl-2-oxobutanoate hydroxymethyltransferase [Candidatus Omnitrophota bacterium]
MRITISDIQLLKNQRRPIAVLTAYDYPFAQILDGAGTDIILVGDSLANAVLGLKSTTEVGIEEMVHHAKAVNRAVKKAMVVGDLPFSSYQIEGADVLKDARRLIEAGCDAVKVEWFKNCLDVVKVLRSAGLAVMGHIGLTPQTADELGGFKVQGRTAETAKRLYDQALALQQAECFSIVLECVPGTLARIITEKLTIPTIGIGAGAFCDGQVLVLHDMLGLLEGKPPKFVRKFADYRRDVGKTIEDYLTAVRCHEFPGDAESYGMQEKELEMFIKTVNQTGEFSDC